MYILNIDRRAVNKRIVTANCNMPLILKRRSDDWKCKSQALASENVHLMQTIDRLRSKNDKLLSLLNTRRAVAAKKVQLDPEPRDSQPVSPKDLLYINDMRCRTASSLGTANYRNLLAGMRILDPMDA